MQPGRGHVSRLARLVGLLAPALAIRGSTRRNTCIWHDLGNTRRGLPASAESNGVVLGPGPRFQQPSLAFDMCSPSFRQPLPRSMPITISKGLAQAVLRSRQTADGQGVYSYFRYFGYDMLPQTKRGRHVGM